MIGKCAPHQRELRPGEGCSAGASREQKPSLLLLSVGPTVGATLGTKPVNVHGAEPDRPNGLARPPTPQEYSVLRFNDNYRHSDVCTGPFSDLCDNASSSTSSCAVMLAERCCRPGQASEARRVSCHQAERRTLLHCWPGGTVDFSAS